MTRQVVREALVAIFVAEGTFNVVLGYAPVDTQGMDKILSIYSDSTHHKKETQYLEHNFYTFSLDVIVRRASGETTEDTLDALHEVIRSTISDNQGNVNWEWLSLEEPSDAYFAEISGVAHRVEKHRLAIKENA